MFPYIGQSMGMQIERLAKQTWRINTDFYWFKVVFYWGWLLCGLSSKFSKYFTEVDDQMLQNRLNLFPATSLLVLMVGGRNQY